MKVMEEKEPTTPESAEEADIKNPEEANAECEELDSETPPEEAAEDDLAAELAKVKAERDDYKEQVLRARAEFDNFRKRTARETARLRKTAAQATILDLLPVVDNLERALEHVEDKTHGLAQGMEMVSKQFCDALAAHGVEPIPALGEPFDPNVHEAMAHQPSEEYPADTVMIEFQRGYMLDDLVLRPTKVVVSSGPADTSETPAEAENSASENDKQ